MHEKNLILSLVVMLCFSGAAFAAGTNMKEGNWEIVTSVKAEGVPFPIPPMKMTHCYTKKEIEESKNPAGGGSGKKDCEMKDLKMSGNTATWTTVCKDGSKGSGKATYSGTTFSATLKMRTRAAV